ncbi:MAG: site-specific integrase, partial [Planctomycetes bacterium]|nr:site-specific integrase [Planctomycetota bacterium]
HLLGKANTTQYTKLTVSRIKRISAGCKFISWSDVSASKTQRFLAELRDNGNGISNQSFNYYLQAIKQFCRWMVLDRRASENPLVHLKGLNTRTDRRHDRRALEPDELRRLFETTRNAPERFGMSGPERAMLYRVAVETGLRGNELRTLKISSFDLDNCTVTVQAAYSKRRRQDTLPLRKDTANELRGVLRGKLPETDAFRMPSVYRLVKMLRADLADANIDYVDEAGKFADFHSLRHSTGSLLAA